MIFLLAVIAFVQAAKNDCTTAPSCGVSVTLCAVAPGAALTAGNEVFVAVTYDNATAAPTSVTDTGGSLYALMSTSSDVNQGQSVALFRTISAVSSVAVTANFGVANNGIQVLVAEYSGGATTGNVASPVNNQTTANPSVSVTTQQANNWVVGTVYANNATTVTGGTNKRIDQTTICGGTFGQSFTLGDNTAASATSVSVAYTATAGDWQAGAVEICLSNPCVASAVRTPNRSRRMFGVGQ